VTDLLPPTVWNNQGDLYGWWSAHWYPEILLSPDGSQAAFTMVEAMGNSEADLFTINTDGSNLRQLTSSTTQPSIYTGWTPVAWSPDGKRLLANRTTVPVSGSADQTWPSEVHIITVGSGADRFVTKGYAVDWHEQP
jgi:Tol biopolymer transport system component